MRSGCTPRVDRGVVGVPGRGVSTSRPVAFPMAMMAGVLVAAILWLLPAPAVARGRSVQVPHATYSLPVRDGVGSFTVRLAHPNPTVPPLVMYDAHPVSLDCSVTYFDYSVSQLDATQKALGTLRLRLRCQHVPAGARVTLKLRDPIVLRVPIRRSRGRIAFSLDKPPGRVLPLATLRTHGVGGPCRTRGARLRIRRLRLDFTSGVTCERPTGRSTAVLTVGGLLRSRSSRGTSLTGRSVATPPAHAAAQGAEGAQVVQDTPITCTGQGAVTVVCTQSLHLSAWKTISESYTFAGCPAGYHYRPGDWPGWLWSEVPNVGPRSDGDFFGVWTFTNWALIARTLNLTWFCGLSAPQLVTAPTVSGAAVVGSSLSCTNGTWNGYPNSFDYEWLSDGDVVSVGQQYTVASSDYQHSLQCQVTAHNAVGSTPGTSLGTPPVVESPPQSTAQPTMLKWDGFDYSIPVPGPGAGTVSGGDWLQCTSNTSSWIDAQSITFQWLQDGPGPSNGPQPISGETGRQYQVANTQAGAQVACQATASNQAGSTSAISALSGIIQKGGGGIDIQQSRPGPP